MVFLILIPATVLMVCWLLLFFSVSSEDWIAAAYAQVVDNRLEVQRLQALDAERAEQLAQYHGVSAKVMALVLGSGSDKKIAKLERSSRDLQDGDLSAVSPWAMPGYVLLRRVDSLGHGAIHKGILSQYTELYGRKYAPNKTKQLMAKLLSYGIIGVAASLAAGAAVLAVSGGTMGLVVTVLGTVLVGVLVYAMYDEVHDRLNKRRKAIARQFPNVVSKLALLVTSGMIMDRAWRETAQEPAGGAVSRDAGDGGRAGQPGGAGGGLHRLYQPLLHQGDHQAGLRHHPEPVQGQRGDRRTAAWYGP